MLKSLAENFTLKIIALAASLLIWLYVGGEQNPTITRVVNAEIKARGEAPEKLLVRIMSDPIPVEVSGPQTEVESIADNEIKAVVNLSSARSGDRQLKVLEWERPRQAPMVTLRPLRQFVDADVKAKVSKRLPITAFFQDAPPSGRAYGRPKLSPPSATVTGAKEDVERAKSLAVYIETKGGGVRANLPIQALDAEGVIIDTVAIDPPLTQVELDLIPAPASRNLTVNVQLVGQPAAPYTVSEVSVSPSFVSISGRPEQIAQMRNVSTGPVSLEGLTQATTIVVPLVLPDGVSVQGNNSTVRVTIRLRDASRSGP